MANPADVERRLAEAWDFLAGQQVAFRRVVPPQDRPHDGCSWQVLLPFVDEGHEESACLLTITAHQARAAAATLFGVAESDLTQADVDDAMLEAGNLLGSCLLEGRDGTPRIGLPTLVRDPPPSRLLAQYEPETCPLPRIDEIRPRPQSSSQRPSP